MKLTSIASSSSGNSTLVESADTRILIDAGISAARLGRRLRQVGVSPESVDAVIVTHEHRDHTAGAGVAARRWGWPLVMTAATRRACAALLTGSELVRELNAYRRLRIGPLEISPFLTCHDAADPVALTVEEVGSGLKVGVATDLGRATTAVRGGLAGCHFLVIEANHDEVMLRRGPYPWSVKQRIGGSRGHLSNRLAAELTADVWHQELACVLLAHLSEECNNADLARTEVGDRMARRGYAGRVEVAPPHGVSKSYDIARLREEIRARGRPQLELFS